MLMGKKEFIQFLKTNKWILFKVINTYCKDVEDRKDLEQEILIQLWKSLKSYDPKYKMSTWTYRIAMNVAVSFYRSNLKRTSNTFSMTDSVFQLEQPEESLDEERQFLHEFIAQLEPFKREILILHLEEVSYKDISEIVGISESNVGTRINRIKKELKAYFLKLNQEKHGNE